MPDDGARLPPAPDIRTAPLPGRRTGPRVLLSGRESGGDGLPDVPTLTGRLAPFPRRIRPAQVIGVLRGEGEAGGGELLYGDGVVGFTTSRRLAMYDSTCSRFTPRAPVGMP